VISASAGGHLTPWTSTPCVVPLRVVFLLRYACFSLMLPVPSSSCFLARCVRLRSLWRRFFMAPVSSSSCLLSSSRRLFSCPLCPSSFFMASVLRGVCFLARCVRPSQLYLNVLRVLMFIAEDYGRFSPAQERQRPGG
jgi:hypothetical protein